jgi:predicted transcriptional regulator
MEMYLAVIKVLETMDSMTRQQIIRRADLDLVSSKESFDFLVKFDLIREETLGSKKVYTLTDKGQRVGKYFGLNDEDAIFDGTGIFRID